MATRVVEGKKPYTWWKAIDVNEDKVISLKLRDENNLIIYDEWDNEIYVDLQLPDGVEPLDAFPVWVNVWRVLIADDWDVNGTLVVFKTTSGDNIKLLYWDDWKLYIDNGTGLFKQIYLKWEVDALLQALKDYTDAQLALKQDILIAWEYIEIEDNVISAVIPTISRFLSIWNASNWEPISFPASIPFTYTTWDYYLIEWVWASTNYRPAPVEYDGTASQIPEPDTEVADWDVYIYDGTVWLLQENHNKTVSFQNIAWDPYDNTNLATALNAKANTTDVLTKSNTTSYTPSWNYNPATKKYVDDGLSNKQATLVSGTNIKSINSNSLLGSWDLSIAEVPSWWTNGQVLTQTSQWPAWQNATWWADIEYKTQSEYNALLPWALTDNKHYFIYEEEVWPTPPSPLPAEYQEVEYIGCNAWPYINPWLSIESWVQMGCEIDVYFGATSSSYGAAEVYSMWSSQGSMQIGFFGTDVRINLSWTKTSTITPSTFAYETRYLFEMDWTPSYSNANGAYLLAQYEWGNATRPFVWNLYSAKLYKNNQLVRDFVPCYRIADDEIGLYDLVNDQFYTNAGSGSFSKWNDVN